ncbi:MAG: FHA domain-containing protein [Gammaproteobacteria bacterium]|nr:FHA domain-containing protein [Gammaproteobacteria bacterium]
MAKLIKMQNGEVLEEYPITKSELKIGRALDNDIILHDETVSSHHAVITAATVTDDGFVKEYRIQDLQSTNKTFVNNKEITERKLQDKDIVRVGLSHFEFDYNTHEDIRKEFQKTTKLHKSWIPGVFYTKETKN